MAEQLRITKPLRLIELFAGIGAQARALEKLGVDFEHYRICEFDKYAVTSYNAIHGTNFEASDITQIKAEDLGIVDKDKYAYLMTYSFPCGLAGTKVITDNGYKNIEDINEGDKVLTHTNSFQSVVKTMTRVSDHYYTLKGTGVPELYLTAEHPLYVLRDGKEQWVKVKDLTTQDKFAFNINVNSIDVNISNEYLWLLGRYVADGWINPRLYNSVEFAVGFDKAEEFEENIPADMLPKFKKFSKCCWEYRIADKELQDYCKQFGSGALNKHIPQWVIDLPKEKLEYFFNGYFAGDGHTKVRKTNNTLMFSTVSENLFLGMQQVVAKLYGVICTCSIRKDNRKPTFNDTYNCQFIITDKHINQKMIGNKIFTNISSIERFDDSVPVYNFEVDVDNSYTCQNVIVHNCQDISNAGKMRGFEKGCGTRSGLLWEVERLLQECVSTNGNLPDVLLMENVPGVISQQNIGDFLEWVKFLESLGYSNKYDILNSKDYGVPQNRDRCFMVSWLNPDNKRYTYTFPKKIPLEKRLGDVLYPNAPESYYLSDECLENFQTGENYNASIEDDGEE